MPDKCPGHVHGEGGAGPSTGLRRDIPARHAGSGDPAHPELQATLWRSLAERAGDPGVATARQRELPPGAALPPAQEPADGVSRRRFMTLLSATAAFGAAGCSAPHDRGKLVPYTKKPPEVLPGVADYYASAYQEGTTIYPVLVKAREGRPIHLTGNDEHPDSQGKTTLRAQAEVLGLYDPDRLRESTEHGKPVKLDAAVTRIVAALQDGQARGARALLATGAVLSPTRRALIEELRAQVPGLVHVAIEPAADHAARLADAACYGSTAAAVPRLDRAKVVLAVEADFMSTMPDSARMIREYSTGRRVRSRSDGMNRLYALEGRMSLTGSNADHRLRLRPSRTAGFLLALARELGETHHLSLPHGCTPDQLAPFRLAALVEKEQLDSAVVDALVHDLATHRGESLVLAGPALPLAAQVAARLVNYMLDADGATLDTAGAPAVPLATPEELAPLLDDIKQGRYATVVFWDCDPVGTLPDGAAWKSALEQVALRIYMGTLASQTSQGCSLLLATSHWLEGWGDFDSPGGVITLQQPLIEPLYSTPQGEEILIACVNALGAQRPAQYYDYLRERWQKSLMPEGSPLSFEQFWNSAVHDGFLQGAAAPMGRSFNGAAVVSAAGEAQAAAEGMELVLLPDACLWDGRHANNPWLQELPDPVSKQTWGNAAALSPADAERLGVADGDVLEIAAGESKLAAPALVQPGQAPGVVSIALGYGCGVASVAAGIGVNAFPMVAAHSASPYLRTGVSVVRADGHVRIVRTQEHWALEGRDADIVHRSTLAEYAQGHEQAEHESHPTLYPERQGAEEKWGMAIDLTSCVGCSGCMIACQSENNIPTVGPEQVARSREMHWIRIDRYYSGEPATPEVVHEPMLCQQCDDAPCENVCPVAATTHSPDGLNQMVYNRCVGTRYCSNNCPYKVRRFNFFDYHLEREKEPQEMVFNPEVSVRPRGVMEKCTFCVQRIQDARMRAKAENRKLGDGEITPACAAACPAQAIVFGNLKDPESEVSRLSRSDRGFKVLEVLGVRPAISYLAHLTNPAKKGDGHES